MKAQHDPGGAMPAVVAALAGAASLSLAWRCDGAWFERHVFLPYYFVPPTRGALCLRVAAATAGLALLAGAWTIGRRPRSWLRGTGGPSSWVATLVALLAAVPAAEGILRVAHLTWRSPGSPRYELKIGHQDPRYGWVADAARLTTLSFDGRPYRYAVGPSGLRAAAPTAEVDLDRPTLIVTGESIASGYGLDYDDTFAARCGRALGLEVAIVAEGGYGVDQAYLRVTDLLPKVRRPAALVTVFVASQLGRSLRDDRPRLGLDEAGRPTFLPAATGFLARTQLSQLFHDRVPYAGSDALARSVALARTLFVNTARAARARGARPLFVIVSPGPGRALDGRPEAGLVRALFEETGLPYLLVDLEVTERLDVDGHPNRAGATRIAAQIEAALRKPDPPPTTALAVP